MMNRRTVVPELFQLAGGIIFAAGWLFSEQRQHMPSEIRCHFKFSFNIWRHTIQTHPLTPSVCVIGQFQFPHTGMLLRTCFRVNIISTRALSVFYLGYLSLIQLMAHQTSVHEHGLNIRTDINLPRFCVEIFEKYGLKICGQT